MKINVIDVDDNAPKFAQSNNVSTTLGVKVNAPIYTEVTKLEAVDVDADALPVNYHIEKIVYQRPRTGLREIVDNNVFIIDQLTGVMQTNTTYGRYADGYFEVTVKASNAPQMKDTIKVQIFVLQDTELLRFVFNRDPTTVQKKLPEFTRDLEGAFAQPLRFNIYDTEFYSKVDGSLDFGRTSSCFQVMSDDQVVDLKTSENIFAESQSDLEDLYQQYDIVRVEVCSINVADIPSPLKWIFLFQRCAEIFVTDKIDWIEISLLVIGALIGTLALIAACVLCCLYNR